jgi:hypothetical protein
MAILHAPFSCPSSLLDSTTFSGGLSTQLSSLLYRLSTASRSLALWVDLLPLLYLYKSSGKVVLERSEIVKSCLRQNATSGRRGERGRGSEESAKEEGAAARAATGNPPCEHHDWARSRRLPARPRGRQPQRQDPGVASHALGSTSMTNLILFATSKPSRAFRMKDVHTFAAKERAVCVMVPEYHHVSYNITT